MVAQLLGNRAQTSLERMEYRSCVLDCDAALSLPLPASDKSSSLLRSKMFYRKCKALFSVRRYRDCLLVCDLAVNELQGQLNSEVRVSYSICMRYLADLT